MKNVNFLLTIFIFGLLQSTILDHVRIFGIKPELLLTAVIALSVSSDFAGAFCFGLLAGILKDIFGTHTWGINTLLLPLWCYLVLKLSRKITIDDTLILMAVVFVVIFLNDVAVRFIFLSCGEFIPLGIFVRIAFIEAAYGALSLPLVSKILRNFKPFSVYKNEEIQIP